MTYRVHNATRDKPLASRAERAESFTARFVGLMGKTDFPVGAGLQIAPCNSIHTFFMRIPIDVLFLDAELKVVHAVPAMPAWRATKIVWAAKSVLELPAGVLAESGTVVGDQLRMDVE
jgi:uncharacterized membrane protein (UPF0127 family)